MGGGNYTGKMSSKSKNRSTISWRKAIIDNGIMLPLYKKTLFDDKKFSGYLLQSSIIQNIDTSDNPPSLNLKSIMNNLS